MPVRPAAPVRRPPFAAGLAAFSVSLLAIAPAAWATPDPGTQGSLDPVMRAVTEASSVAATGVASTPESRPADPGLLHQVREHATAMRDRAADAVLAALQFVGVRYRKGGASEESGFDCSGFTRYVFASLGLSLPRRADEQAHAPGLVAVKRDELKPGDLVFFNTLKHTFSHVGIYIGDNRFVHAPRPGGEVRTEDMGYAYWKARYTGARRVEAFAAPAAADPAASATSLR
jgi:cell wall-associated NlpC family hydrolase